MFHSPLDYLQHIIDECDFIISKTEMIPSANIFLKDETLKRAFSRSIEIIGEASKKITVDNKLKWKQIQWKQIAGMRDRLVHDYTGIDYELVWDIAINKIPELKKSVEEIIESEKSNN